EEIRVLARPEERNQHLALAQKIRFVHAQRGMPLRRADLEDDVARGPELLRIVDDGDPGGAIRRVLEACVGAGPGLDGNREAQFLQLARDLGGRGHAALAVVNFLRDSDLHSVLLQTRQIERVNPQKAIPRHKKRRPGDTPGRLLSGSAKFKVQSWNRGGSDAVCLLSKERWPAPSGSTVRTSNFLLRTSNEKAPEGRLLVESTSWQPMACCSRRSPAPSACG